MKTLFKKLLFLTLILITCLLLINVLYYFYSKPRNIPGIMAYGMEKLIKVYPGWKKEEIKKLLIETWSIPFSYEPVTQFKERPCKGKYVNVDDNGYRHVKNQGAWPPEQENYNIFFFGGSTAFGYGVDDASTIASQIQEILSDKLHSNNICVYNFGRAFYYSSSERLLFQELLLSGNRQDLAIFLDGLNDANNDRKEYNALLTQELRAFIDSPNKLLWLRIWKSTKTIPIFRIYERLKMRINNFISKFVKLKKGEEEKNICIKLKNSDLNSVASTIIRYKNNKKMIESIASQFNVKTLFVWQPVPDYKYNLSYHIFWNKYKSRQRKNIKSTYLEMAKARNDFEKNLNFLWLANMQEDIKKPLYVDTHHYSAQLSKEIAENICNYIIKNDYIRKQ